MSAEGASYRDAGVDYDALDSAKRLAMLGALSTSALLGDRGGRALDASRGEPAFVFELGERTLALVLEGLGTKSMIARAVLEQQGVNRFADVAYDAVAAILNDLVCVGALPLVVNAYFATGDSRLVRAPGALHGAAGGLAARPARTPAACGGEGSRRRSRGCSPAQEIELAGAAVGAVPDGVAPILGGGLRRRRRDRARGTRAACTPTAPRWRACVAERLPEGFATPLADGRRFGEALLDPTRDVRGAGGGAAAPAAWRSATSATSPATGC